MAPHFQHSPALLRRSAVARKICTHIESVSNHIVELAMEPDKARLDATALLEQLRPYTWEKAASTIMRAANMTMDTPTPVQEAFPDSIGRLTFLTREPQADEPTSEALFDVYTPKCLPYYLHRQIDEDLQRIVGTHNLWLWGTSGTGKTTGLRRWAMDTQQYAYVSLAACPSGAIGEVLSDIYAELCRLFGQAGETVTTTTTGDTIRKIVRLLGISPPVIVHVDELPDDSSGYRYICLNLAALMATLATAQPTHNTRFAITTVADPRPHISTARIRERLTFECLMPWLPEDIYKLIDLLVCSTGATVSPSERERLCQASRGSPRYIKTCVRKMTTFRGSPHWSFERVLTTSAEEVFI